MRTKIFFVLYSLVALACFVVLVRTAYVDLAQLWEHKWITSALVVIVFMWMDACSHLRNLEARQKYLGMRSPP